jgi:hypothetical protein
MAPVLQCPDCGHRHPLHQHDGAATFRCSGCRRLLKVPEPYRRVVVAPEPTPWAAKAAATAPPVTMVPPSSRAAGAPLAVRGVLWVLALPISLWLVYRGSRLVGLLNRGQVEDLFFDTGWGRFWPLARLLPIWALLCAGLVQLGVLGYDQWRRRAATRRRQPPARGREGPAPVERPGDAPRAPEPRAPEPRARASS